MVKKGKFSVPGKLTYACTLNTANMFHRLQREVRRPLPCVDLYVYPSNRIHRLLERRCLWECYCREFPV